MEIKNNEDEGPFIFKLFYYIIAFFVYMLMAGVYGFSITQVTPGINRTLYLIFTIGLLIGSVYVYFKYPENN